PDPVLPRAFARPRASKRPSRPRRAGCPANEPDAPQSATPERLSSRAPKMLPATRNTKAGEPTPVRPSKPVSDSETPAQAVAVHGTALSPHGETDRHCETITGSGCCNV